MALGRVAALWRYPMKSLQGEQLDQVPVTPDGVVGDRAVALVDPDTGTVLSGKRVERLVTARAVARPGGPVVMLEDGTVIDPFDAGGVGALSSWLGRPVQVARAAGDAVPEIEGEEGTFHGRPGTFFDSSPIHAVTTATLAFLDGCGSGSRFDPRRFRPNLVIDAGDRVGPVERDWIGGVIRIGALEYDVVKACRRCRLTTSAQADLPMDRDVLRTVARHNQNETGVYLRARAAGICAVGDQVDAVS